MNNKLTVIGVLFLLVIGVWLTVYAPCGCFKYTPSKDIPGRCMGIE